MMVKRIFKSLKMIQDIYRAFLHYVGQVQVPGEIHFVHVS